MVRGAVDQQRYALALVHYYDQAIAPLRKATRVAWDCNDLNGAQRLEALIASLRQAQATHRAKLNGQER